MLKMVKDLTVPPKKKTKNLTQQTKGDMGLCTVFSEVFRNVFVITELLCISVEGNV